MCNLLEYGSVIIYIHFARIFIQNVVEFPWWCLATPRSNNRSEVSRGDGVVSACSVHYVVCVIVVNVASEPAHGCLSEGRGNLKETLEL